MAGNPKVNASILALKFSNYLLSFKKLNITLTRRLVYYANYQYIGCLQFINGVSSHCFLVIQRLEIQSVLFSMKIFYTEWLVF